MTNPLPVVELPDEGELPEGWNLSTVREISSAIQYGYTESAIQKEDGLRFLRITDIQNGGVNWDTVPSCEISKDNFQKFELRSGDIVFARTGATTGKSFLIQSCPKAVFASYLIRISPNEKVDSKFLFLFFQTPAYWQMISENVAGIAQPNCNASKLKNLPIPLPPLAEQQRIVARVEALLSHVDAAGDRLSRVPAIMKRFRQAVLAAACSGRLTEEWREENPSQNNCDLLRLINTERQAIIQGKQKRTDSDTEWMQKDEREIPEQWLMIKINDILHYQRSAGYGVLQPGSEEPDGIPMVRVCDIHDGKVLTNQLKRISPEIEAQYKRTRLEGGEVLVTLVGTIGRTAVVPKNAKGSNVARAVAVLPLCPHVDPGYISHCLADQKKNTELVDLAREVARKTLNLGLLKAVEIPLPPLAEQHEIVRRVGLLFERADAIECEVAAAGRRCERLTQAVMVNAFSGKY